METERIDDGASSAPNLRTRLYALGFVDEFGPLYALYTIWFADNGITAAQVSTVFLLWAVIEVAVEVPSGALADLVDRRRLLAGAFLLRAIGISIWIVEPSYGGVIAGAALWSTHQSLASGAWEALIHDELTAIGDARSYPGVMARMEQCSAIGIALGAAVAMGAVALGATIPQLGWATVAIHGVSIALVLRLPDVRWVVHGDDDERGEDQSGDGAPTTLAGWWATLRLGLRFARRSPLAVRLIGLGALIEGLYLIDDYVPLVASERGSSDALIPVFVIVIFVGLVVGDEIVVRRPNLSGRAVGIAMTVGATAMVVAMLTTSMWPLLLVGFGYLTQEVIWLISDARFQQHVPPAQRATVTSVRSFCAGLVSIVAIGLVTLLSTSEVSVWALAAMAGVLAIAGFLGARWIPEPRR